MPFSKGIFWILVIYVVCPDMGVTHTEWSGILPSRLVVSPGFGPNQPLAQRADWSRKSRGIIEYYADKRIARKSPVNLGVV